jgi:hypothetical protein
MRLSSARWTLACLLSLFVAPARIPTASTLSAQPRIIDAYGRPAPSIFYGSVRNPRFAIELQIDAADYKTPVCKIAVYRESEGLAHKQNVYCGGHYQKPVARSCGSYCRGGEEHWTYADAGGAAYTSGWDTSPSGCNTGKCNEHLTCYNPF